MTTITQFTLGMSNAFILRGEKTVLVDSGCAGGVQAFCEKCREHGINPSDISLIIISHGHVDHFTDASFIKELTGAPVMVHKLAADTLRYGRKPRMTPRTEFAKGILDLPADKDPVPVVTPCEPDILVKGEVDLHPYGVDAIMAPTPGHSPCSYSIFLDSGEAIVGDVVLENPATGSLSIAWFADDVPSLVKSIELILDKATLIYSGHGGPFKPDDVRSLYKAEFSAGE